MCEPTTDDLYAYALSRTLTMVSSPATVGLYSSCQDRINIILKRTHVYLKKENQKSSMCSFLTLIGRMLFYQPIWTEENQKQTDIRFIYVHFSAWHFAGSDLLWAGLVLRLFQAIRMNFGKLQLVLFRVAQNDENEGLEKKIVKDSRRNWRSKKLCCLPLWLLSLCIVIVPVIILILLLTFKPNSFDFQLDNVTLAEEGVLEGLTIAAFGVPAATALRFAFLIIKNLIFNEDRNIRVEMDNPRISSQLGFMNEVRKEMLSLSRFIHFMEVFEKRKIRVVLEITHLDRCSPRKIVAVLDAMNILLSDEDSPFISILAVNPDVLVQKVNFADGCFSKEDRAYALLNRIVTLLFTVPPLCDESKLSLFNSLASNSKFSQDKIRIKLNISKNSQIPSSDITSVVDISDDNALEMREVDPLIIKNTVALETNEDEVERSVRNILTSSEDRLNKYMSDDAVSLRRVINSIRVTVIIMKAKRVELPQPEHIAAWVVLANEWPCRLSWIIQCAEDAEQRADIDGNSGASTDDSKTLWKLFSESKRELYVMRMQIEDLLEQDGDPEMFEKFLTVDFQFTLKDLKLFNMTTVNLDHSIKKALAQIRGTSRLKDFGWMKNIAPLPIRSIINMNTEDVCIEMERMEYPSKYIDIVKKHDLNGSALVFGNVDDLKALLGMTFGEWTTFQLHFLGLQSYNQQNKNTPSMLTYSQKQQTFSLHGAHY